MHPGHALRRVAAGCALALPALAGAQPTPARLVGRVVDQGTAAPVAGAEVELLETGRSATTDSAGRFIFLGLVPGLVRVRVRAEGFLPVELLVSLRPGGEAFREVPLEPRDRGRGVQALAPVAVSAAAPAASYRLVDFERRRRTGRGHYLDDEAIRRSGASNLVELTRSMRGVSAMCGSSAGCRIQMARARRNCEPEYVVDGRAENMFGAVTPIRDIVALEVYTGPSDVPGEFAGTTAGCGVVVIWTRTGPPPKSKD